MITLAPYQNDIVDFLNDTKDRGFIIAQMGLGKTMPCLEYLKDKDSCLVVAPEIVIRDAWDKDTIKIGYKGFNNVRKTKKFTGRDIVDYYFIKNCHGLEYDIVIFDEVTFCKHHTSDISKACLKIKAAKKIGMTATPIHTNILVAFGIIKLINPNALVKSKLTSAQKWKDFFYSHYTGGDPTQKITELYRGKPITKYARKDWQKYLAAFFYPAYINMDEPNQDFKIEYYNFKVALFKETKKKASEIRSSSYAAAQKKVALYQLGAEEKKNFLADILAKAKSKKIVIFINYLNSLDYLKHCFNFEYIIESSMAMEDRISVIDRFNKADRGIMLASVKCCSHGVNLNTADLGIYFDLIDNYESYAQSVRRLFRKGKEKDLKIFSLYTVREELDRLKYYSSKKLEIFYEECRRFNGGG
ncbi:MAG: DNA or RNA helicase of superfamily II [Caudoviricetes sp.]|nr:MAG: DNA or RNA helicase of superfamily II [Caudoviricetes sp.]